MNLFKLIVQNKSQKSFIVILTFLIAFYGKRITSKWITISFDNEILNILYGYAWWVIPVLITLGLLFGFNNIFKELRLNKGFKTGVTFAFICVSPMLLGYLILGGFNKELNPIELVHKTLLAGTFEELLFRGFLFGILFRKLKWGFVPATLIGAIIFGISHIYQGNSFSEITGIFFVTFFGAIWFSWLFVEWKENLWVPICLHVLMNFSWIAFSISDTGALGGYSANIFRILTLTFTVVATIIFNRKKDMIRVTNKNLLIN